MPDQSYLDSKYFIDIDVYNCPFCNRRNVKYVLEDVLTFNWSHDKKCFVYFVRCASCVKVSMHLSYEMIAGKRDKAVSGGGIREAGWYFHDEIEDIDSKIFYSRPTSFFVLDSRIRKVIRELVTEAEGCLKMNFLTGASACIRKAIYELTIIENAEGTDYEAKIKSLKQKYPNTDPELFDTLAHIQDMTSNKIHEQSWPNWDSKNLTILIETLKAILHEICVLPDEKKKRSEFVKQLRHDVGEGKTKRFTTEEKPDSNNSSE